MLTKLLRLVRPKNRKSNGRPANGARCVCAITLRDGSLSERSYSSPAEYAEIIDEQRREIAASTFDRRQAQRRTTQALCAVTESMEN